MHPARLLRFLGALVAGAAAISAAARPPADAGRPVLATPDEKVASFAPYRDLRLEGRPLGEALAGRTALLLIDYERIGNATTSEAATCRFGVAAAVSSDGYFLTAAHCVGGARTVRLLTVGATTMTAASVAWLGDPGDDERDLALLHIDGPATSAFEWAPLASVTEGADLVAVGAGNVRLPEGERLMRTAAGGRAIGVSPPADPSRDGPPVSTVIHSVLMTPGDSGGPLATPEGRLVGIEVRVAIGGSGRRYSIALRPDPAWVRERVDRDRDRRARRGASGDAGGR